MAACLRKAVRLAILYQESSHADSILRTLNMISYLICYLPCFPSELSPRSRAAVYERLAQPVARDSEAISALESDQANCTFSPSLSYVSREKFPANGGFQDRLEQYSRHFAKVRSTTPPLERECTFSPTVYVSRKDKVHQKRLTPEEKEEMYKRLAKYHVRSQQQAVNFSFQPALNIAKSKAIQVCLFSQMRSDTTRNSSFSIALICRYFALLFFHFHFHS